MTGTCGTSQTGTIYNYYICNGIKKKRCHRKTVPKHYIEDIVLQECKQILTDKNINLIAKQVYSICKKENSQSCLIKSLEKQLKEINRNIENLMVAIESGQNIDLISQRLTQKRTESKEVIRQIDKEKSKLVNLSEEQISFFLSQLKNGNINDIKYRKTLVNIFINRIYVYDKELTIIFNINNEKITVNTSLLNEITSKTNNTPSLFLNKFGQPVIAKVPEII